VQFSNTLESLPACRLQRARLSPSDARLTVGQVGGRAGRSTSAYATLQRTSVGRQVRDFVANSGFSPAVLFSVQFLHVSDCSVREKPGINPFQMKLCRKRPEEGHRYRHHILQYKILPDGLQPPPAHSRCD